METNLMAAKDCLKNARYQLGMSQKEFSEFLGIHKSTYSLLEAGKRQAGFIIIKRIVNKLKEKGINVGYEELRDDK